MMFNNTVVGIPSFADAAGVSEGLMHSGCFGFAHSAKSCELNNNWPFGLTCLTFSDIFP